MRRLLAPKIFYQCARKVQPWTAILSILLLGYGIINGVFFAPNDYQQGAAVKIIYLHVPSALLSISAYMVMGSASFIYLVWKPKIADVVASSSAPIGACFTLVALISGALWGKPMWGTYWVWDARLTSELILLFLYMGYIALRNAIYNIDKASYASAILAVIGLLDLPIIHFSVEWWHTLHQGASISRFAKPAIATPILYPLLAAIIGMYCLYVTVLLITARTKLLEREARCHWVKELLHE